MDFLTKKITLISHPLHFDNIHSAIHPLSFTVQQKFTNIPIETFAFHLYEHRSECWQFANSKAFEKNL